MNSQGILSSGDYYIKFGNGLLIQWGHIQNQSSITFPQSFSNTNYAIIIGFWHDYSSTGAIQGNQLSPRSIIVSGFTCNNNSRRQDWLAIGY